MLAAGGLDAVPVMAAIIRRSVTGKDADLGQAAAMVVGRLSREVLDEIAKRAPEDADCAYLNEHVVRQVETVRTALEGLLSDPDPAVRIRAAQALGRLGGLARTSLPRLERATADADEGVREAATQALAAIRRALDG